MLKINIDLLPLKIYDFFEQSMIETKTIISSLVKTIWQSPQLRNILLLSLIITLIFPLYNTLVTQPQYNALLVQFIEDDALRVGKHLSKGLVDSKNQLLKETLLPEFKQTLNTVKKDFSLEKITR